MFDICSTNWFLCIEFLYYIVGFSFGQAKSGGLFGSTSQPSSLFQTPQASTNVFGGQSFGSSKFLLLFISYLRDLAMIFKQGYYFGTPHILHISECPYNMISVSALGGGTSTASTGLFGSAFGSTTGTSAASGGMFGTSSGLIRTVELLFYFSKQFAQNSSSYYQ